MLIFMLFLLLNGIAFFVVFQFVANQQSDGKVINIAGAQRMLSQKMSKEALLVVDGDLSYKESLGATAKQFDEAQQDLLNGNKGKGIPAASNPDAVAQLNKVNELWNDFYENIQVIQEAANEGAVMEAANYIKEHNNQILTESNKAVSILEANSVKKVNQLKLIQIIILLLNITLVVSAIILSRKGIIEPIIQVIDRIKVLASGDLRVEKLNKNQSDEVGQLAQSFDRLVDNLHEIVGTVNKSSTELAAASEEMAASAEQVTSGVNEISRSTEQVAKDAEEGNRSALEASQVLLELASLIQIAKEKATSATSNSQSTLSTAQEGKETVNGVIRCMETIKAKTLETESLISTLDKYSKEIEGITQTITEIANQTNLLALNAAIEASRAGEAGKGFAVVAEEVRKLAEQSNRGAGQVGDLMRKVTESTAHAVKVTVDSRNEVEDGVSFVTQAGEALEKILLAVNHTVRDINEIQNVTDSEVATSEKIVELINSLSSVIENTAANAQQVSAATQQAAASVETVSSSAEESSAMAADLKTAIERFKI